MKLVDFRIGGCFLMSGQLWRCTDIGSRVAVAICVEYVDVGANDDGGVKRLSGLEAASAGWFNGPPYAVAERVVDEYDFDACEPIDEAAAL